MTVAEAENNEFPDVMAKGAASAQTAIKSEPTITGLDIAMTEIDASYQLWAQSVNYKQTINACVKLPNCVGATGVSDKDSRVPGIFTGYGAPLLLDDDSSILWSAGGNEED
ncbi:hypothetical protein FN846DRAFT_916162 [Sphaerosporella brunnea]|uniref:GH10 domain-containing protein n=1 Tax=Sphaerosporella brunnea TaxID=1250544 RepID=A0A5J5F9C3_9PEZI|nr:hypothetical protein FN846DRAFT_916162 [Sphaerosporella brunnea]